MKMLLKKLRDKFYSDIISLLHEILNKLIKNLDIQAKQNYYIEDKLNSINKDISLLNEKDRLKELIENINNLKYEIYEMKKYIHDNLQISSNINEKLYRNDWEPKNNIKQYLQQVAGLETAEYIIKNMPSVPAFNVTLEILTYGISKVTFDGLYLEFGVFSGKTINHIADKVPNKTIYGFDSFEGLPEDWRTGFEEGTFKRDNLPEVKQNVQLIKGWFNETLPTFIDQHSEKCAFIHIDCDLYSSTKCIFNLLKDRIVSGTIIVFDEYFNYPDWQNGEYKALQEFITENNLSYEYIGYVEIMEQVAIKIL